jgi:DNA-binding CsgD family transcriptional regulator
LLWDRSRWDLLSARWVKLAREVGALTALPIAITSRAELQLATGDFARTAELVAECASVKQTTGSSIIPYAALGLAALTGREAEAFELIETGSKDAEGRGEGRGLTYIGWATAVLCNGIGRYEQAMVAARRAIEAPPIDVFSSWSAAELVEAATRVHAPERAVDGLQRLSEVARASGTDWVLGVEARSRALVADDDNAEALYREAIGRLGAAGTRVDLARAHLLYGEWLRRAHRRIDARAQLRTAHQMLAAMGARGFADRAARERRATGEQVSKRTRQPSARLTARESQIARLARDGLSNPEIAARLFMSPRTVEYHLHKVFTKLAISSRNQLHGAMARGSRE